MKLILQKSQLIWILGLLLIFNIAVDITFIYHFVQDKATENTSIESDYLQNKLGMNNEQQSGYRKIRARFSDVSQPMAEQIRILKSELADEMRNDFPDTVQIRQMTRELGQIQGELLHQIATKYIDVKGLCTPEQVLRLNDSYSFLLGNESAGGQQGKGYRYRHGQNKRNN
jgi:Spy/CpxP family protein refolding chaperone